MPKYLVISLSIFLLHSCAKDVDDPQEILSEVHSFVPSSPGMWKDYSVEEILYKQGGGIRDTLRYFLREETALKDVLATGDTIVLVKRFLKTQKSGEWEYSRSVQFLYSAKEIVLNDNNLQFIKLANPLRSTTQWKPTSYFDESIKLPVGGVMLEYFKNWKAAYRGIFVPFSIDGKSYEKTLDVSVANYENRLEIRWGREVYANQIGLVFKKLMILDTQCFESCADTPWEEKAQAGHILTQVLIDHN